VSVDVSSSIGLRMNRSNINMDSTGGSSRTGTFRQ
jgi:hypothetical protein